MNREYDVLKLFINVCRTLQNIHLHEKTDKIVFPIWNTRSEIFLFKKRIIVTGMVADAQQAKKQCTEVLKQDGCVQAECGTMCVQKRGTGAGRCSLDAKGHKKCFCLYHCA